jgi:hypothetical protein
MAHAGLFAAIALFAQPLDSGAVARLRAAAAQDLRRLPDYTCTMNIERSARRKPADRFERMDSVRLEVALVDGKELFAWPGSQGFSNQGIMAFVPGGAISSGDFAAHARQIFLRDSTSIQYIGLETIDDRRLHHFRFQIPRSLSRYFIGDHVTAGIAGYEGDAWAEEDTFRLARLAIHVNDPPEQVSVRGADDTIDYQVVRIEGSERLLPRVSELTLREASGRESRNHTVFADCRQYGSVSTLRFDVPEGDSASAAAPQSIDVPDDLYLKLTLSQAIDPGTASAGDPLRATLSSDVKAQGRLLLPKGAEVTGRILAVVRVRGNVDGYQVVMRLESASWKGFSARLRAELIRPVSGSWLGVAAGRQRPVPLRAVTPGLGVLQVVRGSKALASGFPMTWRTLGFSGGPQP